MANGVVTASKDSPPSVHLFFLLHPTVMSFARLPLTSSFSTYQTEHKLSSDPPLFPIGWEGNRGGGGGGVEHSVIQDTIGQEKDGRDCSWPATHFVQPSVPLKGWGLVGPNSSRIMGCGTWKVPLRSSSPSPLLTAENMDSTPNRWTSNLYSKASWDRPQLHIMGLDNLCRKTLAVFL